MKTYVCDSCGEIISNPHDVGMKEFYIAAEIDEYGVFPWPTTRKTRVDLCDTCFKSLKEIAKNKEENLDEL